jgi:hypothetical protein
MIKAAVELVLAVQPRGQHSICWRYPIYDHAFQPLRIISTRGVGPFLDLSQRISLGGVFAAINLVAHLVSYCFKILGCCIRESVLQAVAEMQ